MEGTIRTICAECDAVLRVKVNFPTLDEKFEDCEHTCEQCGTKLLVTDTYYD